MQQVLIMLAGKQRKDSIVIEIEPDGTGRFF